MVKSAIVGYWAATAHDWNDIAHLGQAFMIWDTAKYTVRGLTTLFLMGLFMKINARALPIQNPNRTINHFLVPVIMLGILSVFIDSLIDQYFGPVDSIIK